MPEALPVGAKELLASPLLPICEAQLARFSLENLRVGTTTPFNALESVRRLQTGPLQHVYAVDLGGDKISGDRWSNINGIIVPWQLDLKLQRSEGEGFLDFLEAVTQKTNSAYDIGLSVAGPLQGTKLDHAPNMGVLKAELVQKYGGDFAKIYPGRKVAVLNDALAGLMTSVVASAQKSGEDKNVLYLINGSGLGGALYKDGQLIPMEPGHIGVEKELNPFDRQFVCDMNERGEVCLESLSASRAGVEQLWYEQTDLPWDGIQISKRFQRGHDTLTRTIYDNSAAIMGHVVAGVGKAFGFSEEDWDRTVVVLHGGTSRVPGYAERMGQYMRNFSGNERLTLMLTDDFSPNACQEGAAIGLFLS